MGYYWFPTPKEAQAAMAAEIAFNDANDRFQSLFARNLTHAASLASASIAALSEEDVPLARQWMTDGIALLDEITAVYVDLRAKQRVVHENNERMGLTKMAYA